MISSRISLPDVTILAISSVNIDATVAALSACTARIDFAAAKLVTHQKPACLEKHIEFMQVPRLTSSRQYSRFVLQNLASSFETSHCLLVQWDGYALRPEMWRSEFLEYDYIGASWPQFDGPNKVGNGGFSLRSRKLAEACRSEAFRPSHPEDLAIGRKNRAWLESIGCRFAPCDVADQFSAERAGDIDVSFGFHGVWHMPHVLGQEEFFKVYRSLDERSSLAHDLPEILMHIARGPRGLQRVSLLLKDWFYDKIVSKRQANREHV